MLNKVNHLLTTMISCFIGTDIGFLAYGIWHYHAHPELYAPMSAPWYTEILARTAFTAVIVAILVIAKLVIRYKMKKDSEKG